MAKLPCIPESRIFTLKETGETMSYDQVRQYLMSNPELWLGKGEAKGGPLSSVEVTTKALEQAIENNPAEFIERPDGRAELVGGIIKLQLAAQKGDKKNSVITPSKIPFLPSKIALTHLAKSKSDKNGILKDGFDIKRVNIDSPIPGIYFSSEDWSTMGRFGRSKENALFVEIENDGLLYFDSSSDFRKYLKENKLPYQGETLSKKQLEFLKGKGVKGILLREDFASQSKNELIIIDDSIIKDISESEKPITKLPSSFSEPNSISEAYHAAKKDGTNPELVKAVEDLLGEKEGKEVAMPKGPYVKEVIPNINEEQAAGEKEVEALKKGDKITTTNPIRLLKGIYGKRNADGSIRSAHTGVNGIFSSITEKIARRYEGEEGVVVFEIPAGVTMETIEIANTGESKGTPISLVRQMETDAINASDAQVVKLITFDSRGRENQYIIKDPALRKIGYKPSQREAEATTNTPEAIAARIRNKKQKGALSAIDFGISVTIYNGALEFMAAQVEKGTKLGNAIANTIKWIDEKMAGAKWNKGAFGKYMNDTYSVTLPNGREVEVVRDDSKETAEVINGWYSELEQKILDSKEDKLPAATWAKRLKSKEDEDVWTGVRGFLESKKPSEQVSKKELRDWMKDNRVEISEVVKGEGYVVRDSKADKDIKEFDDYEKAVDFVQEERKKGNDYIVLEKDKGKSVKFEQYQLEGDKENYKEVLVTLPSAVTELPSNYKTEKTDYGAYQIKDEKGNVVSESRGLGQATVDALAKINKDKGSMSYIGGHFIEPNILVHLRMNTRTDVNGNKVLFLEEVQSDFQQEYRKQQGLLEDYIEKNSAKVIEAFKKKGILEIVCP